MELDSRVLASLLTMASLVAGTILYAGLIRRRVERRLQDRRAASLASDSLRGLVRVFHINRHPRTADR